MRGVCISQGIDFILPTDVVVADKFAADAATQTVSVESIPEGWMGLDNGPESTKMIQEKLGDCKTVIWNGPMVRVASIHPPSPMSSQAVPG